MPSKLIIVADLGHLRAYRETRGMFDHGPHLELVAEADPDYVRGKRADQVTDRTGRFPKGSGPLNVQGDLSSGEQQTLQTELTRRAVKDLAERICLLLETHDVSQCSIAVSAPVHKQLLEALPPTARDKIRHVLPLNLVGANVQELQGRFAQAS